MNKEIQKLLASNNKDQIAKGLKLITQKGTLKEIPLLLNLLLNTSDKELELELITLFSDIKIKEANKLIIEAFEKRQKTQALLQICWQSRLDFSSYLMLFIDIFIQASFEEALEAFTLIEVLLTDYNYPEKIKKESILKLKESLSQKDEQNKILAMELIKIFEK